MSEKKDKKQDVTASQENVRSLAGIAALASAIFSVSEPEEIADVPEEPRDGEKKTEENGKSREEKMIALIEKGKKAGHLTLGEISEVLDGMDLTSDQEQKFYDTLAELNIDTMGDDLPPIDDDEMLPALDELENVQRTGDIFFPKDWLNATLAGHSSPEAAAAVRGWIDAHPGYPPLLMSKLLQSADILMRANP